MSNPSAQIPAKPFRSKHYAQDKLKCEAEKAAKARPETAKAAFDAIRKDLDGDPMAAVWDEKLTTTQKHGLWLVAGLDGEGGGYHFKWIFLTDNQKYKLERVISTFAGLAVRIKGAVS